MAIETYEVVTSFIIEGQYAAIVNHFTGEEDGTGDDFLRAQHLVDALIGGAPDWPLNLAACLAEDCFISSMRARRVSAGGGNTAVRVFATDDYPGSFGGECEPQQVAGCVIWVSSSLSVQATGRTFLPGVSESATENARFNAAYLAAVQAWVDGWIAGVAVTGFTAGMFMSIFNRVTLAAHTISYGYVSPKVGTQRRRLVPV